MSPSRCMNPLGRIGQCLSRVTVVNQQLTDMMSDLELTKRNGRYICATCRSMLQQRANDFREAEYAHYVNTKSTIESNETDTDVKVKSEYYIKGELKTEIKVETDDTMAEQTLDCAAQTLVVPGGHHGSDRTHNLRNRRQTIKYI